MFAPPPLALPSVAACAVDMPTDHVAVPVWSLPLVAIGGAVLALLAVLTALVAVCVFTRRMRHAATAATREEAATSATSKVAPTNGKVEIEIAAQP